KKARFKAPFGWKSPHSALRCRRPCPREGGGTHSTPFPLANARQPRCGSLVLTRPTRRNKGVGGRLPRFTPSQCGLGQGQSAVEGCCLVVAARARGGMKGRACVWGTSSIGSAPFASPRARSSAG